MVDKAKKPVKKKPVAVAVKKIKINISNGKSFVNTTPVSIQNFTLVKKLGKGGYGHVGIYRYKKRGKKRYIIKKTEGRKSDKNEVVILRAIKKQCPKYFPCYRTSFYHEGHFYIVMELDTGYISMDKFEDRDLSNSMKARAAINALVALRELHKLGVAHLDFKPHNVIIHPKTLHAKLIDFGLSCDRKTCKSSRVRGTRKYMSPEMVQGKVNSLMVAKKSDVWSVGIFLYNLVHGTYPWKSQNKGLISNEIVKTKQVRSRDKVFGKLIMSILKPNPKARPSLTTIIRELTKILRSIGNTRHRHSHTTITNIINKTTNIKK